MITLYVFISQLASINNTTSTLWFTTYIGHNSLNITISSNTGVKQKQGLTIQLKTFWLTLTKSVRIIFNKTTTKSSCIAQTSRTLLPTEGRASARACCTPCWSCSQHSKKCNWAVVKYRLICTDYSLKNPYVLQYIILCQGHFDNFENNLPLNSFTSKPCCLWWRRSRCSPSLLFPSSWTN